MQRGDTLWGLSEQLFEDGFYWPTLWSYNPQVTNPHWIFPGDLLFTRPKVADRTDTSVIYAKSRYNETPRLSEVLSRFLGFVADQKYKSSGKLTHSREEKRFLGQLDEVYLRFSIPKRILAGEEFTIYRPVRELFHPEDGRSLGWLVRHLGMVRVLNVEPGKPEVKGLILDSYEEIQRGDLVTKRVWDRETVVPVENKVGLWSRVLDEFHDVNELAEYDYVIIDKGYKQKMRRGNRLILRWRGDGLTQVDDDTLKKMPWENLGEIMVVEPFESTSLAVVIRSVREVHRGDLIEMVRGY